jgi:hypothetical protein
MGGLYGELFGSVATFVQKTGQDNVAECVATLRRSEADMQLSKFCNKLIDSYDQYQSPNQLANNIEQDYLDAPHETARDGLAESWAGYGILGGLVVGGLMGRRVADRRAVNPFSERE